MKTFTKTFQYTIEVRHTEDVPEGYLDRLAEMTQCLAENGVSRLGDEWVRLNAVFQDMHLPVVTWRIVLDKKEGNDV